MILILDNNNNRAIGLNASLGFIGEAAQLLSEDCFEQECKKYQQQECMIILGALQSLDHESLIKRYPTSTLFINWRNAKTTVKYS